MFKFIVKELTPPFAYKALASVKMRLRSNQCGPAGIQEKKLFDGNDGLFKSLLPKCSVYGEYGCGDSTVYVAENSNSIIFSVDTSIEWIRAVRARLANDERAMLHHVDLGNLGEWGRPLTYDKSKHFGDYTDWLWHRPLQPDLVLVDGRFRVCSFLTCLKHAKPGVLILFDVYVDRPHYHYVERYVQPIEVYGRQALFEIPHLSASDIGSIDEGIVNFRYVFD